MTSKSLSETAATILSEGAAEILNKSKASAGSESFGLGKNLSAKAPKQDEKSIGTMGHKTTDSTFDATAGVPTATPPGAKPPVGSEPMKKITGQPQQGMGRKDLAGSPEGSETSDDAKVNRQKGPMPKQTFKANPGAKTCAMEDELEEATMEEVESDLKKLSDEEFQKKYGVSKQAAEKQIAAAEKKQGVKEDELEEATIEEVEADLKKLSDEEFQKKYGVSKQAAEKQIMAAEKSQQTKEKMKEDVNAMLSGENLSEEFKEKATMIFEAAVEARVEEIAAELEERYTEEFNKSIDVVKEDFSEKLDSYLD